MTRSIPRRAGVLVVLLTVLGLVVSGCATLPDSSSPQAIGTLERGPSTTEVAAPVPGREPDLLLRDFLQASTDPTNRHRAARQFLTGSMSQRWDDAASTTIVDKVDVLVEQRDGDSATYVVRANTVGHLEEGGVYRAADGPFEARFSLVRTDGEWRIDEMPPGVIMDRPRFLNSYRSRSLYFVDPSGTAIVPDPRWITGTPEQTAAQLIGLLVEGPKTVLAPAVQNLLEGLTVVGAVTKADGRTTDVGVGLGGIRIDFQGIGTMSRQDRELLAAQVIWTLANADISGPYQLLADGQPLDERFPNGWTTADVASMNPLAASSVTVGLHALLDGGLVSVAENGVTPVRGFFGNATDLQSVALSLDGELVAAVQSTGKPAPEPAAQLMIGTYTDGVAEPAVDGEFITRPSWAPNNNSVWAVVNGTAVVRAVREPGTGRVTVVGVEAGAVRGLGGRISELRLSRDGVRAALIVDGRVFVATVVPTTSGEYALTNPREIGFGLGGPALALDWSTADTIVVSRAASDVPVVQIAVDGSRIDALPSRNLTPPVVAVEASTASEFVADSRTVFQLNNRDPAGDRYWREVPGLAGLAAIPVLPG
ncbi:MtrAB system accessory lipoprotein LpqB [Rhodococcus sp. Z13]|uniref:MtrAB system accessory lipoprotein LpqB n=1 Tax=Rhodococcus sacchari TaxID=2962047 RepID=A0ACD4DCN5_9NOCA|nr:MtrAB system accessory lipoprotein LpqB [Rhodococcus sp. Z13]UYP17825.1 MtrAB system accessory lipoprotein LpqB [Rhodococcus sp. Z13]